MGTRTATGVPVPCLREWREWAVLSQKMLAKEAGLDVMTISSVEHGQIVRFKTIRKLAKALQITPQQLLYEHPPH